MVVLVVLLEVYSWVSESVVEPGLRLSGQGGGAGGLVETADSQVGTRSWNVLNTCRKICLFVCIEV